MASGAFSVELGAAPQPALPGSVFAAAGLFVETVVEGTTLQPRRSVGTVPFAVHADNGVPAGSLLAWAGTRALPAGWRVADGGAVSRAEFPDLYAAIGEDYGDGGDGAGPLFNLPDMRGRVTAGAGPLNGNGDSLGPAGVRGGGPGFTVTLGAANLPPHQHSGATGGGNAMRYTVIVGAGDRVTNDYATGYTGPAVPGEPNDARWPMAAHTHNFVTDGGPGQSLPVPIANPSLVVNYLIKI